MEVIAILIGDSYAKKTKQKKLTIVLTSTATIVTGLGVASFLSAASDSRLDVA